MPDVDFVTDDAAVMERAERTPEVVQQLIARPCNPLVRLNMWLSVAHASGTPRWEDLSPAVAAAARELGFRPVTWIRWGHLPLPLMKTPQFVGPDGFVKLEYYRRSGGVYLATTFDDGTALTTTASAGANARTEYMRATGDLRADYAAHLARVAAINAERGVRPLYRPTPATVRDVFRLFYRCHIPTGLMVVVMTQNIAIAGMLLYALAAVFV